MRTLLLLALSVLLVGSLTACNTVRGVGQDVSALGRDISAGAEGVESNR
jgi:predicted small secreted protein